MQNQSSAPRSTTDEAIRLDAAEHPERGYRAHVEAAVVLAAPSYREEIRRMMKAGTLDDSEAGEEE